MCRPGRGSSRRWAAAGKQSLPASECQTVPVQHARTGYRQRLTAHGLQAVMTVDGATDADVFRPPVKRGLGPPWAPGDSVVMDHRRAHTAVGIPQAMARRGARLFNLPPSSPARSPMRPCGSDLKTAWRTAKARTRDGLDAAIKAALPTSTAVGAQGWFRHCGLCLTAA